MSSILDAEQQKRLNKLAGSDNMVEVIDFATIYLCGMFTATQLLEIAKFIDSIKKNGK